MVFASTENLYPNVIRRKRDCDRPLSASVSSDGTCQRFTFADVERASNRAAWLLSQKLGRDDLRFVYIGPSDIRYLIWVLAAMKIGKCVSNCDKETSASPAHYYTAYDCRQYLSNANV
jgi:acyl-coenzyme A synthetase/AMP-(fatty) acid ligase